ncbi:HlyD family type I secretion periplasmic adaptor subunit [Halomonas elongata]|uniref:HlyD family type I secretion periplasmic adaptor subunit n=1 Tax=Halomonas elongata TaxID=2746 RepID=UPI00255B3D78|nr:HlyD family type I secretion periplasmic adaptor subunit [Halomonas elongata]MDL4863863.1 HlyD family type I secretion periplasmic adaptor subunit [Halomonas elongata]
MSQSEQPTVSRPVEAPDWQALAMQRRRRRPRRLAAWMLLGGFALFVAWAAWAPLDNGIAVPATVVVSGDRQAVEHPVGGLVERLWVNEGDRVERGQVLVDLDSTRLRSEVEVLRTQHAVALAEIARLEAERDGHDQVIFPETLTANPDAAFATQLAQQRQLFTSRRAALNAELDGIAASLRGERAQAAGLEASLAQQRVRLAALGEQRDNLRQLADEGYVPRNRVLEIDADYAQLQAQVAVDGGNLTQTRQRIVELGLRRTQRLDEYRREVGEALSQATLRADELDGKLATGTFDLEHSRIRAPATGAVVGLTLHTEGGVVQPGELLMEIVPDGEPLIVEGQLPVERIDRVHPGLPVELMFTAFDRSRTPRLPGEVTQVSADRLVDEQTDMPYYRLRVAVSAETLSAHGVPPLKAGMPVEAFVRTGERSMLNYLFKPLWDRVRTAWGDA